MTDSTHDLLALIEAELAQLHDARALAHVRSLLVPPRLELRDWDYGAPGEAYPCWMELEDPSWNIGLRTAAKVLARATPGVCSI